MTPLKFRPVGALLALALALLAHDFSSALSQQEPRTTEAQASKKEAALSVQYLEVVTPNVDATCTALERLHGVSFDKPEAALGNARTAQLRGGGRIGVRAPMREDEAPVVRPYALVEDIDAAVKIAEAAGGQIAVSGTDIPGHGKFAIYFLEGIQYGLWEL